MNSILFSLLTFLLVSTAFAQEFAQLQSVEEIPTRTMLNPHAKDDFLYLDVGVQAGRFQARARNEEVDFLGPTLSLLFPRVFAGLNSSLNLRYLISQKLRVQELRETETFRPQRSHKYFTSSLLTGPTLPFLAGSFSPKLGAEHSVLYREAPLNKGRLKNTERLVMARIDLEYQYPMDLQQTLGTKFKFGQGLSSSHEVEVLDLQGELTQQNSYSAQGQKLGAELTYMRSYPAFMLTLSLGFEQITIEESPRFTLTQGDFFIPKSRSTLGSLNISLIF